MRSRAATPGRSARGRILYDFSGNACEGYALQFRQVSELDNGEGKITLSDLRSTTWEDGAAQELRLQVAELSQSDSWSTRSTGRPSAQADKVAVTLTKPQDKKFDLDAAIVFPTDHMRRIIQAARAGKSSWRCRSTTARTPARRSTTR